MNRTQILILIGIAGLIWLGYIVERMGDTISTIPVLSDDTNEVKHGEVKQFTTSGKLKTVINYHNGVKHGISYLYHDDGKTVLLAIPYENGKREGTSKKYFDSGEIYAETDYSNDQLHGVRKVYYSSGLLKSKVNYWKGLPGIGTEEYLMNGTQKEPFSIQHIQKGNIIYFSTNAECKKLSFSIGLLEEDSYYDPISDKVRLLLEEDGRYFIDLNVFTPSFLKYQDIICHCESSQGNPIILKKRISL